MKKFSNIFEKYKLEFIVFWSGLSVMVLEIAGSRVLSPYIGASIFVWTSLIGVVLLSLSVGYWYGGKLADKNASFAFLSKILLAAGILVFITELVSPLILYYTLKYFTDLKMAAVFYGLVLFGPASFFMGMVSPYAVKLKLESITVTGTTVGRLYSISTFGSIVGTFLTGFYLFGVFRTSEILLIIAATLIVLSIISNFSFKSAGFAFRLFGLILILFVYFYEGRVFKENTRRGFIDVDTSYSRIWIVDREHPENGRPIRYMLIDSSNSSSKYLDGDDPVNDYLKYFDVLLKYEDNISKSLLIGGAAYSFPTYYLKEYEEKRMDVVEIDSRQTELAKQYFGLRDDSRLRVFHEDGRTYASRTDEKYDVVFLDAYNALVSIPYHLTTKEFFGDLYRVTNDRGIVVANIISPIKGEGSEILNSYVKTLSAKFSNVLAFKVKSDLLDTDIQNIVLVAMKKDSGEFLDKLPEQYLESLIDVEYSSGTVLTDDYAPLESMVYDMIQGRDLIN